MPSRGTELKASSGQASLARAWAGACMMTGLTIISARFAVHIPQTPVPITLQVFAVLLTGLLLGPRWGSLAQLQYLALGAFGLPVFAAGGVGIGTILGLTGGYLVSYPIAVCVMGWIARPEGEGSTLSRQALACVAGLAIIYGLGCAWYAAMIHASLVAVVLPGALIFVAWDSVKAAAAIAFARGIQAGQARKGR